jgi:hypothetical protein
MSGNGLKLHDAYTKTNQKSPNITNAVQSGDNSIKRPKISQMHSN